MQKEDLDVPGNARTIITMDYIHGEFFFPPMKIQSNRRPNSTVNPLLKSIL